MSAINLHKTGHTFSAYDGCPAGHLRSSAHCSKMQTFLPYGILLVGNARAKASSYKEDHLMATITGTVKFFNTTKGFGFISPEGGGKDAFVHISAVQQSGLQGLYENDKVTYDIESGRDGKESAVNLTLL